MPKPEYEVLIERAAEKDQCGGQKRVKQLAVQSLSYLVADPARLRSLNRAPKAPSSRFLDVPAVTRTRGPTWMHRG